MASSKVFIDANVLIEITLRRINQDKARKVIAKHIDGMCISALTGHLVMHFSSPSIEFSVLNAFLANYTVLELTKADFDWAFANIRGNDFEDALQLAVAVRNGCSQFITFDKKLYDTYNDLPSIAITLL